MNFFDSYPPYSPYRNEHQDETINFFMLSDNKQDDNCLSKNFNALNSRSITKTDGKVFSITKCSFLKKKRKQVTKFSEEEDERLTKIVNEFPYLSWYDISKHFESKTPNQLKTHYENILKPGIVKGKWSEEEDAAILEWVKEKGPHSWSLLRIKGRNCKQIRERWVNNLKLKIEPNVEKIRWSEDSENKLIKMFLRFGSKWSVISRHMENTTENIVKNKFYCMLRSIASKYMSHVKIKKELVSKRKQNSELSVVNNMINLDLSESVEENWTGILNSGDFLIDEILEGRNNLSDIDGLNILSKNSMNKSNEAEQINIDNADDDDSRMKAETPSSISQVKGKTHDVKVLAPNNGESIKSEVPKKERKVNRKKRRDFLSQSELLKFLPFLIEERNIPLDYQSDEFDTNKACTNFDFKDWNKFYFKNLEVQDKRKEALKKIIKSLNKKRKEIQINQSLITIKKNMLLNEQVELLNKVLSRLKYKTMLDLFNIFKART